LVTYIQTRRINYDAWNKAIIIMPKVSFKLGKFQKDWEERPDFKGWLKEKSGDMGFCKLCQHTIRPHLADIKRHATTQKHKANLNASSLQKPVVKFFTHEYDANDVLLSKKKTELRLSLFIACHSTLRAVDPLGEIIQADFGGSAKDAIRLHRTKCRAIIAKVLGPFFKEDLIHDLANAPFSILVDEATDISVVKILGLSIRYYSSKMNKIVTTYLGMVELTQSDAIGLTEAVSKILQQ